MIVSTSDEFSTLDIESMKETGIDVKIFSCIEEVPLSVRKETEVLVTFGNDLNEKNIYDFERLKWIQLLSAGLEDLPFMQLQEIKPVVSNAKGIHTRPMAEYLISTMLYFEKDFNRYSKLKKDKVWDRSVFVGELVNRKVLIFGTGTIGAEMAKVCSFFDCDVDGVNTTGAEHSQFNRAFTLEEGLKNIGFYDYVVSVLPLTPNTKNMFTKSEFERMKKNAVFINAGRGGLVNEADLAHSIEQGEIKGAALDVFVQEPLPKSHYFWDLDNVLITPHMSAKSIHYLTRCKEIFEQNYKHYENGNIEEMINLVDLHRYY
ncbi:D-2-hydroxyacid dehydrogenase [Alteribacter keqinensis]|uniref:D-2-hydroxyacid dehydrogenase n=1 Tax=Alteribacter keqinensis TaxID=2483800 RepID=A0A3M7TQ02_9BACI|nr:D-2-hydroxyacid dehydrogenase [Alteribacter keqinensis]RNA67491.1 D-2-hydroxyacid dehydrogenase [Alteribacter keqinensis]